MAAKTESAGNSALDSSMSANVVNPSRVPCGLSVECGDHSLLAVEVQSGQTTADVNPADWYAPEGAFPPDPAN